MSYGYCNLNKSVGDIYLKFQYFINKTPDVDSYSDYCPINFRTIISQSKNSESISYLVKHFVSTADALKKFFIGIVLLNGKSHEIIYYLSSLIIPLEILPLTALMKIRTSTLRL